ncbi:preprotein translocase subunit YajC [Atopobium sp. oral taxon 810]|uniref:preprotein translocase subunit YajC n=1 Tax=Atopobium sp. oral taxon 810 TaxID=712158 RepID=UPI000396C71F|nr:preprotein translocase subunit YajC [Atopobium sp. oral taxon 810]ERI05820.1 preprotein translocase, YajC subunit [Atopobium sp. oral taxon 810 str. F0209]
MTSSFWQQVLSSSVALLILFAIITLVYALVSYSKGRKQRNYYKELHSKLKVGQQVVFAGGLIGVVTRVGNETCDIRLKSNAEVEVSRFSIQQIDGVK